MKIINCYNRRHVVHDGFSFKTEDKIFLVRFDLNPLGEYRFECLDNNYLCAIILDFLGENEFYSDSPLNSPHFTKNYLDLDKVIHDINHDVKAGDIDTLHKIE